MILKRNKFYPNFKFTFAKVWLALTFFPIENEAELAQLRALLLPFEYNVRKCGEFNGENRVEKERIVNDIINTASSTVDEELVNRLNRVMIRPENGTINLEHKRLQGINLRLVQIKHDQRTSTTTMFDLVPSNISLILNRQPNCAKVTNARTQ